MLKRITFVLLILALMSSMAFGSLFKYPVASAGGAAVGDIVDHTGAPTDALDRDAIGMVIAIDATDGEMLVANSGVYTIAHGFAAGSRLTTAAGGGLAVAANDEDPLVAIAITTTSLMITIDDNQAMYSQFDPESGTSGFSALSTNVQLALHDLDARLGAPLDAGTTDYQTLRWDNTAERWIASDELTVNDAAAGSEVVTIANGNLTLETATFVDETNTLTITENDFYFDAGNDFDVAATNNLTALAGGAFTLDADGLGTIGGAALDISADAEGGDIDIYTSVGDVNITTDNITGLADEAITFDAGGLMDLDAGANLDIDVTGNVTVDATTGVTITPGADMTIAGADAGDLLITNASVYVDADEDYYVGLIGMNDAGADATTSGATLVGYFASARFDAGVDNVQEALDDLDERVGGGIEDGTANGNTLRWNDVTGVWEENGVIFNDETDVAITTPGTFDIDATGAATIAADGLIDIDANAGLDIDVTGIATLDASTSVGIRGESGASFRATTGQVLIDAEDGNAGFLASGNVNVEADDGEAHLAAGTNVNISAGTDAVTGDVNINAPVGDVNVMNADVYVDAGQDYHIGTVGITDITDATNSGASLVGYYNNPASSYDPSVDNVQEALDDLDSRMGAGVEDGDTDFQTLYWDNTAGSEGWKRNDLLMVNPTVGSEMVTINPGNLTMGDEASTIITSGAGVTETITITEDNVNLAGATEIDLTGAAIDLNATANVTVDGENITGTATTNATITAGTNVAITGGTNAAMTATAGIAAITAGDSVAITSGTGNVHVVSGGGDMNITGTDVYVDAGQDYHIGTIGLTDGATASATTSGAYLVGAFDEFDYSDQTNVQGVLNDLDAAISAIDGGTGAQSQSYSGAAVNVGAASGTLTDIHSFTAYNVAAGSELIINFSGVFDDRNTTLGAGAYMEVAINVNGTDVGTQTIILTDRDYFQTHEVSINHVETVAATGDYTVTVRARTIDNGYAGGRFVSGVLNLIKVRS